MSCDFPIKAYRSPRKGEGGKPLIVFNSNQAINPDSYLMLPCGRCVGCRLERSRQWALRCVHEAQLYPENTFITLTYNDEHLPDDFSVHVRTWQLFMKKLRKSLGSKKIRNFSAGEYTDTTNRPHYHSLIFNHDFSDKKFFKKNRQGDNLYTSQTLSDIWGNGFCTLGDVTFESAAYVARYVMKKQTGENAPIYYTRQNPITKLWHTVQPEFVTQSRRPGLGAGWLERFKTDVYPSDFVIERNTKMMPPRFYDQQLSEEELDELKKKRQSRATDQTFIKRREGRLDPRSDKEIRRVRAAVRDSKIKAFKRELS